MSNLDDSLLAHFEGRGSVLSLNLRHDVLMQRQRWRKRNEALLVDDALDQALVEGREPFEADEVEPFVLKVIVNLDRAVALGKVEDVVLVAQLVHLV